jgi:hypothetical protein
MEGGGRGAPLNEVLGVPLAWGDEITILQAVSGGSRR